MEKRVKIFFKNNKSLKKWIFIKFGEWVEFLILKEIDVFIK